MNIIAFSPDGKSTITGSDDGTVRVWDTAPSSSPKTSQSLPAGLLVTANRSYLYSLTPDGQHLLTLFTNGTFSIWDTRTFTESPRYSTPGKNVSQEALAPGGNSAAFAVKTGGSNAWDVVVWDVSAGQARFWTGLQITNGVGRIGFSLDGKRLAFGCWPHFRVFDVASGKETHRFSYNETNLYELIHGLAFSRDGRRVAAVTTQGWALVWDLRGAAPESAFHPIDSIWVTVYPLRITKT